MILLDRITGLISPKKFGSDTDKSMKSSVTDIIVRSIMYGIGSGDLAEDCDGIELYCQNQMYLEFLPAVKKELYRQLCSTREDLEKLIVGLRGGNFRVYDAAAPEGATMVEGIDVPVYYVIMKRRPAPRRLRFYDAEGNDLFEMVPPSPGERSPVCFIGRNVSGGRHNDISLEAGSVSRSQAFVAWKDCRWQSECNHTWIDRSYLTPIKIVPLPDEGTLFFDEQMHSLIKIKQEPL